jgi:hypothetical protein
MSENSRIELALATTLACLTGIIVGDGYVSIACGEKGRRVLRPS